MDNSNGKTQPQTESSALFESVVSLLDRQSHSQLAPHELLGYLGLLNLLSILNYLNPQGQPPASTSSSSTPENPLKTALQSVLGETGSGPDLGEIMGELKNNPEMMKNVFNLMSSMKDFSEKNPPDKKKSPSSTRQIAPEKHISRDNEPAEQDEKNHS